MDYPPSPATSAAYWCSLEEADFAKEYFSRIGLGVAGVTFLQRLQLLAHRHFYGALPAEYIGDMPSAAEVTRSGEQGQNVEIRVNKFRAHVNAKHQIIVGPKLTWGAQATNTDAKSLADASRAASILEYMWKSGSFESDAVEAELGAILFGEEFLVTLWNAMGGEAKRYDKDSGQIDYEGNIESVRVASWNVRRDPTARSYEESPWKSAIIPRNKWDLIAKYPAMRDAILAVPPAAVIGAMVGSTVAPTTDPDKVLCHYFFHERRPSVPLGLQAVMLSADCILEFDALEKCYFRPPIHRCAASTLKGTPYAYTSAWEAMAIQDLMTDIQGSLATNIVTFGKQMLSAESDTDLPVAQLGNGPLIVYRPKGTQPPTALVLAASPPESFKHLDRLNADQRQMLGLNDMAMGEPPQGPPNAQAWALLSTANVTNNSGEQRNFVDFVRSVGRSILAIVKEHFSVARKVAIVGVHGAAVPKQEEFDKADFEGIEDVMVEIANPLMQNTAGRLQIATMNIDRGFVQVPEQLEQLVTTGTMEPMTQTLRDELIYIAGENEELLSGAEVQAMITDSHQMHIREHKAVMFSADARKNPKIIAAASAHIYQHIGMATTTDPRVLALLGQAVPQPPAPPAGSSPGKPGEPTKGPAETLQQPGAESQDKAQSIKLPTTPESPLAGGVQ